MITAAWDVDVRFLPHHHGLDGGRKKTQKLMTRWEAETLLYRYEVEAAEHDHWLRPECEHRTHIDDETGIPQVINNTLPGPYTIGARALI